jgi:hypothetical protein
MLQGAGNLAAPAANADFVVNLETLHVFLEEEFRIQKSGVRSVKPFVFILDSVF